MATTDRRLSLTMPPELYEWVLAYQRENIAEFDARTGGPKGSATGETVKGQAVRRLVALGLDSLGDQTMARPAAVDDRRQKEERDLLYSFQGCSDRDRRLIVQLARSLNEKQKTRMAFEAQCRRSRREGEGEG